MLRSLPHTSALPKIFKTTNTGSSMSLWHIWFGLKWFLLVCYILKNNWPCYIQSWALLFCQSPFYVKIDSFWARDLISCVNGCFWSKWRWVNSFFDFCPFLHTFLTFFENPKKPKMSFFELETWFFGGREVFDHYEHKSTHFFISTLLRSKMALYS